MSLLILCSISLNIFSVLVLGYMLTLYLKYRNIIDDITSEHVKNLDYITAKCMAININGRYLFAEVQESPINVSIVYSDSRDSQTLSELNPECGIHCTIMRLLLTLEIETNDVAGIVAEFIDREEYYTINEIPGNWVTSTDTARETIMKLK